MSRIEVLPNLREDEYCSHNLHGPEVTWEEKNCYVDLWIELLHTLKLEPLAMLPLTLAVDFEDDQWTFFKPSLDELRHLYGIDVQELTVWKPLIEHALTHLSTGKLISTEVDAYWLPDTEGTDYRRKHSKTTILLTSIDMKARRVGYFHNAGYFELAGEDFLQLFRLNTNADSEFLPLYAEYIRIDSLVRRSPAELSDCSYELLQKHFARRPIDNPIRRFGDSFAVGLVELQDKGLSHYHAWAFASIRQAGAAFSLATSNLRWQVEFGHRGLSDAADYFESISQSCKVLILKVARAVNTHRSFDANPLFSEMANAWDLGMAALARCLKTPEQQ